ncbi:hypothetical protein LP419_39435 [Massilia sp. H-1]|nr:hypothetical protein LP419_39435 [Massilia sp. H-1]
MLGRAGKNRFVPLSVDDPIHPCFLEHGIDSVEKKVSWIGFRISETCHAAGRVCLLDCLAPVGRRAWRIDRDPRRAGGGDGGWRRQYRRF